MPPYGGNKALPHTRDGGVPAPLPERKPGCAVGTPRKACLSGHTRDIAS